MSQANDLGGWKKRSSWPRQILKMHWTIGHSFPTISIRVVTLGLHSTHLLISTRAAEYWKHRTNTLSIWCVPCVSNFTSRPVFLNSAPLQHLYFLANNTCRTVISQRTHNRKENRFPTPSWQTKIYYRHNKPGCKGAGFPTQSLERHRLYPTEQLRCQRLRTCLVKRPDDIIRLIQCLSVSVFWWMPTRLFHTACKWDNETKVGRM